MTATKIQAAVFDFDGMIFDTRDLLFEVVNKTLKTHGFPPVTKKDIWQHVGKPIRENYAPYVSEADLEKIVITHRALQDENRHLAVPYDGLIECLEKLKQAKVKMAVFTSRGKGTNEMLTQAKARHYFDAVITADDVENHKPHPEGLLKALEILKVGPDAAAMLGDSTFDIEAGKAAKVAMTIAVTHGFGTLQELKAVKPDHIVDSLAEIPPLILGKIDTA